MIYHSRANKHRMSQAATANKTLGVGNNRNSFKPRTPGATYVSQSSAPQNCFSGKLTKRPADGRRGKKNAVDEYLAVMDEKTGKLFCPECDKQFDGIDALVSHLVNRTMERGYRPSIYTEATHDSASQAAEDRCCVVCERGFAKSYGNKRQPIQVHMDRHFSDRYPCQGKCGAEGCHFVGSASKDLIRRKNLATLPHQCASCDASFGEHKLLVLHVETKHVQAYQVVGYAAKAGFTADALITSPPWMAGRTSKAIRKCPIM